MPVVKPVSRGSRQFFVSPRNRAKILSHTVLAGSTARVGLANVKKSSGYFKVNGLI